MITAILLASAITAGGCGQLQHNEAGGDYTNPGDAQKLSVVEAFHFTADVEQLRRGISDKLGGDIGYTLEHFPNHHRALAAMARLGLRDKTAKPVAARYSIECYFDRALRFAPGDVVVRGIYGSYLLATGRPDDALEQMLETVRLDPSNATTHYNLGLLFVKKKDYPKARQHAREAYRLGFPLPGLKKQLVAARQWEGAD